MPGTINYAFNLQQRVWVISTCSTSGRLTVQEGTVLRIRGTVFGSPITVEYDVQLVGSLGTTSFLERSVFADLSSAMVEYQTRLTTV